MKLLGIDECSGCGACVNICPKNSISMCIEPKGFSFPKIDSETCVGCTLCQKVCPQINVTEKFEPTSCYAAVRDEQEKRTDSASGGIAALMYENFLENDNSVAYGVAWNVNTERVEYTRTEKASQVAMYKGSKYVQPDINLVFRTIHDDLSAGKKVLFVGLPCHVAGCKLFLEKKNSPINGFYCVDILCHGVSSHEYLSEELEWIKKRHGIVEITNISFRSNDAKVNYCLSVQGTTKKKKKIRVLRGSTWDLYFKSFVTGLGLRIGCHKCKFSSRTRVGDMTIGDFLGLKKEGELVDNKAFNKNVSVVTVNTDAGRQLLNIVSDRMSLVQRSYEEAVNGGASFRTPCARHPQKDIFLRRCEKDGFLVSAKCIWGYKRWGAFFTDKMKRCVKSVLRYWNK